LPDPDDAPGPVAGPLPAPEPERLPGGRLLRRRAPMPWATATSFYPGGVLVLRGTFSAVVLRRNRPAGAVWADPYGLWRAAPVAAAARAVSGPGPDENALEALEAWAPSFRRFAEARARVLADLAGGGGNASPAPGGRSGGGPGRGGERPAARWSAWRRRGRDGAAASGADITRPNSGRSRRPTPRWR
jgi:hypothetical protein